MFYEFINKITLLGIVKTVYVQFKKKHSVNILKIQCKYGVNTVRIQCK